MVRSKNISEEREQALVFEQMGRILSEWRFLEDNLESVFNALVDSAHRDLPSVIYYLVNSFPVRMKIIDTLIKFRFGRDDKSAKPPKRIQHWANLRKRIRALESFRNIVAHTHVHPVYYGPRSPMMRPVRGRPRKYRTSLAPSIFDGSLAVRYDSQNHPTLYVKDLIRIRRRIERAWKSVERFWLQLPELRPPRRRMGASRTIVVLR
jgi:hypothetical protein